MTYRTYKILRQIIKSYERSNEYGKIIQQILSLALYDSGFTVNEVRLVEGVDIDVVSGDGRRYAIEVKTTVEDTISNFGEKDFEGLKRRKIDGYKPVLAVLRFSLLSDWIFADAEYLKPGRRLWVDSLWSYRLKEFGDDISLNFSKILEELHFHIIEGGQAFLNEQLEKRGIRIKR